MSVLNRKMFRNRDARNKLAGMGGIQTYNEGGNVVSDFLRSVGFGSPEQRAFDKMVQSNPSRARELYPDMYREHVQDKREARSDNRKGYALGGILASSPELMGTAQRFNKGGDAEVGDYVAVIPGINNSQPLRLSMETLSRLQDSVPDLMATATILDEGSATDRGIDVGKIRPGDAFVERRVAELMGIPAAEPDVDVPPAAEPDVEASIARLVRDNQPRRSQLEADAPNADVLRAMMGLPAPAEPAPTPAPARPSESDVTIKEEIIPQSASGLLAALAMADDDRKEQLLFGDPNNRGAEPKYEPPISPEMQDRLDVLEQRRTARTVSEIAGDVASGALEGTKKGLTLSADAANVLSGYLADTLVDTAALGADTLGYVTGGGKVSDALFRASDSIEDFADYFTPEGNVLPRLVNIKPDPEGDLGPARPSQTEMDSLRATSDAMLRQDPSLFAEGSVSEPLPDGISQSILDARANMQPPSVGAGIESLVAPGPGSMDLPSAPATDPSVSRRAPRPLTDVRIDPETGSPVTMDEDMASVLSERLDAADAGLTNRQEQPDVFPGEDAIELERMLERMRGPTGTEQMADFLEQEQRNMDAAREAAAGTEEAEGLGTSLRPKLRPEKDDAAETETETETGAAGTPPPVSQIDDIVGSAADAVDKAAPGEESSALSTTILQGAGVDTEGMDLKQRTEAMRNVLSDLMGDTPEDEKNEFWMNMAMIGFGIAAGDSSSALKNVADGLLAGTAQIQQGKAAKKERSDKLTLTALGEVLADQRADEKFARDLAIANVRSDKSLYGSRKDPLTQMYMLAKEMYAGGAGDYDSYQDALSAARSQVASDYGIDMGADGGGDELTTQASHKQLNDAAKASGLTEYTGPDGETYKVQ